MTLKSKGVILDEKFHSYKTVMDHQYNVLYSQIRKCKINVSFTEISFDIEYEIQISELGVCELQEYNLRNIKETFVMG